MQKYHSKLIFYTILLITILSGCSAKATQQTPSKTPEEIKIGFPTSGGDWPTGAFGVAIENGYFEEYLAPLGTKVVPKGFVGAAPAIHEALAAKELDYVIYAGMAADLSRANGIEHTLLSVTSWGAYWKLIARTNSGIETLADLKDKKIAYTRGASPHMYLIRTLTEAGIAFEEIEAINSTGPESMAGIAAGSIDAAVSGAGYEGQLVESGDAKVIHVQFTSDPNVYYEPSAFIGRTEFHYNHKDISIAIQKALLKAKDWIKEDPDRYYNLVSERTGNPINVILETADFDIERSIPLSLDDKYIESLEQILTFLKTNKLTDGDINFDEWVDKSVTEKALEEYKNGK